MDQLELLKQINQAAWLSSGAEHKFYLAILTGSSSRVGAFDAYSETEFQRDSDHCDLMSKFIDYVN